MEAARGWGKLSEVGADWWRLGQTGGGWGRLVELGADWWRLGASCQRLGQTGGGWGKLVELGADWYRQEQVDTGMHMYMKAGTGKSEMVQVGKGIFRLTGRYILVQVGTYWYKYVQAGTGRYILIQVGTHWYT